MKNKLLVFVALLSIVQLRAQNRKQQFSITPNSKHELIVAFNVTDDNIDVLNNILEVNNSLRSFTEKQNLKFSPVITWDNAHFDQLKSDALIYSEDQQAVKNLKGLYRLIGDYDNTTLFQFAEYLEKFELVRYVDLNCLTPIAPPNIDIPPTTPNYFQSQGYIKPNPGVNMEYAWTLGLIGTGIKVRDVEYGVSITHEELTDPKFSNAMAISTSVNPTFVDHGTATAGVMAAHNGTYGVTGMVHDITEFKVFPEYASIGYDRVNAVTTAIAQSVAGDVILYEMQTSGVNATQNNPNYVPAEYSNIIWDLTKAATTAGIHIVAAAGNGNQDLDSSVYAAYMNRGDSGALMVGAGTNTTTHGRLSFSTYGSRVNVQGWGMEVLTSGYGSYALLGNDPNQSYVKFSGTSSATPIVASCVVALLQRAKQSNFILKPSKVREVLRNTGIAQQADTSKPIGPLPNMKDAIPYLDNVILSSNKWDVIPIVIYPNPVADILYLNFEEKYSTNDLQIIDLLGRVVKKVSNYVPNSPIDLTNLAKGNYIIKLQSGKASQTKKIIVK